MSQLALDTTAFDRRVAAMKGAAAEAAVDAMATFGDAMVENIERIAPRDTNRYLAGWVRAGNLAGLARRAEPTLQRSSRHEQYLDELRKQAERIEAAMRRWQIGMDNWYHQHPERPRKGWYRKAEREVRKLYKRYVRALRELAKAEGTETFLFFDAGAFVERKNKRALSTVRTKVYGGSGLLYHDGKAARLTLHNLEPHATIVEARFGVVAVAVRGAKALGTRKASRAFIERIQNVVGAAQAVNGAASTTTARRAGFAGRGAAA